MRMQIFSPKSVGSVETRKSIALVLDRISRMRPSCGTRFSEMSSFETTLMRETSLSLIASGGCATS
jgi:hypothetical protein